MKTTNLFLAMCIGLMSVPAMAEVPTNLNVNFGNLTPDQQTAVLSIVTATNSKTNPITPEELQKWVAASDAFAKAVGGAIGGSAKELGMAANDFLATDAGKLTAVALLWNYIGRDWWGILGSSIICPFLLLLVYVSARQFHMSERIKQKLEGGAVEISYVPRFEFRSNDARNVSAVAHWIAAAGITITWLTLAF